MIRLMSAHETLLQPSYHGLVGFLLHWTFWNVLLPRVKEKNAIHIPLSDFLQLQEAGYPSCCL